MNSVLLILLLISANCFSFEKSLGNKPLLIALMGQSNMSGRGKINYSNRGQIPERIYVYTNNSKLKKAKPPIDSSFGEKNQSSKDKKAGYDLAMGAGWYFFNFTQLNVVFIPCAKGGSSLDKWKKSNNLKSLYGNCLKRIQIVQDKFNTKLSSIFFYQGESDALNLSTAKNYKVSFIEFINDLRSDLGNIEIPFIYAQISKKAPKIPYWDIVKDNQIINLDHTYMIKTDHLTHNRDQLHLNSKSLHSLGAEFAKIFLTFNR